MFAIPMGGGRGGAVREQYLRPRRGWGIQMHGIRTGISVLVVGKGRNRESKMKRLQSLHKGNTRK